MNFEVASNITKLSLETSKDIIDNVERIKILTNHTLADIRKNLDVISASIFVLFVYEFSSHLFDTLENENANVCKKMFFRGIYLHYCTGTTEK